MNKVFALLAVLIAALALAACGGDDDDDSGSETSAATTEQSSGGGGESLTVTADEGGQLAWDPTELSAPAGPVTIELDNPAATSHDLAVEGNGVEEKTDIISEDTASLSLDLEAGEYKYYCTVPGHEEAGMTGTLTVE